MDKIKEIVKIVENYNIDFVLHGGDLFDRPDTSVSIVSSFASILNDIKVPIYIVCGNHDIYGHNPDTVNRTMLGLLDSLNIIHIVNKDSKIFLEKDGVRVQLTGYPYTYDIDSKSSKDGYIVKDVSWI